MSEKDPVLEEVRLARETLKAQADNLAKLRALLERKSNDAVPATQTRSSSQLKAVKDE